MEPTLKGRIFQRANISHHFNLSNSCNQSNPSLPRLPCAHTCFNVILVPEYSSKEKLERKLYKSIQYFEGFGMIWGTFGDLSELYCLFEQLGVFGLFITNCFWLLRRTCEIVVNMDVWINDWTSGYWNKLTIRYGERYLIAGNVSKSSRVGNWLYSPLFCICTCSWYLFFYGLLIFW